MSRFTGISVILVLFRSVLFAADSDQDFPLFKHSISVTLTGHLQKPLPNQATDEIKVSITYEDSTAGDLQISCSLNPNPISPPPDARSITAVDSGTSHFVFDRTSGYRVSMQRQLSGNISPDPLFNEHYNLVGFFLDVVQGHVDPQRRESFDDQDRVFIRLGAAKEPEKQPYTFCDWREPLATTLLKGQGTLQLHLDGPSNPSYDLPFEVDNLVVSGYELTAQKRLLTTIRDSAETNKVPELLDFCETTLGKKHCSRLQWGWGVHGYLTNGGSPISSPGVLVVKRFDVESVVLELRQMDGSPIALYTGSLGTGQIQGLSVKLSNGKAFDSTWSATFAAPSKLAGLPKTEGVKMEPKSTSNIVDLPQTMHLCTDHCETLVWRKDHFDGKSDADGSLISTYTVEKWASDGVSFTGKAIKLPVTAVFLGTIAPEGGSIANPSVNVQINSTTIVTGASYQLTWTQLHTGSAPVPKVEEASPGLPTSVAAETAPSTDLSASTETEKGTTGPLGPMQAQAQAAQDALIAQAQTAHAASLARAQASLTNKAQRPASRKRFSPDEAASHLHHRIIPIYPKNETRRPLPTEFYAEYEVVIGLDGKVHDMTVGHGSGQVDQNAARESVMAAIYDPFLQDGQPVECITTIVIKYTFHCSDPQDPSTCN